MVAAGIRELLAPLRQLLAGPKSFAGTLALTIGGLLLVAILALALGGTGLLREQAEEQALARVQLAGVAARDEIRRHSENALTSARLLAGRPTLVRLVRGGQPGPLEFFLRRFCETGGFDACAVVADGAVLAAAPGRFRWDELAGPVAEQGERFIVAPASAPDGLLGATAGVPDLPGTSVVVLRAFDRRLAAALGERVGMRVRLVRLSDWLDTVEPDYKELHSAALTDGVTVARRIEARSVYAASTPVIAATGEAIALIEAQLPAASVTSAVNRFVKRLAIIAAFLAGLALLATLLLANRIGRPLQALARSAVELGRGDFSTSIPVSGTPEVAALARTLEDMRRNLIDATATLRRREAEAQALLQGIVEGVFAVDAQRNVRYLNPQAARMLGIDASAAIGRFCGDVLRPCGADGQRPCETACPILAARQAGKAQATEVLGTATGPQRIVVITSAGLVDGMQVQVMRDETEIEAVRRARDSILANISHEFRTPLAAQQASIELLRDGLAEMPREQLEELVESLQRGTLRLTRLIDNLLESVRIESGQLAIRRQPVDLAQIVEDAEELVAGLFTQRHQLLQVDLPGDLPLIPGDAQRLTQVVTNLLANANKFSPDGSAVVLGAAHGAGLVSLWVEDEGPGVPHSDAGAIFERFYRSAAQEPEPGGLGLGLWIVKSIVERHGGSIGVERMDAGRTRFTVTLPTDGADG
ncbi:MAG: ATP-binding protein [Steroidobacteraceae bacterium]